MSARPGSGRLRPWTPQGRAAAPSHSRRFSGNQRKMLRFRKMPGALSGNARGGSKPFAECRLRRFCRWVVGALPRCGALRCQRHPCAREGGWPWPPVRAETHVILRVPMLRGLKPIHPGLQRRLSALAGVSLPRGYLGLRFCSSATSEDPQSLLLPSQNVLRNSMTKVTSLRNYGNQEDVA
jgi:hypothetical protein